MTYVCYGPLKADGLRGRIAQLLEASLPMYASEVCVRVGTDKRRALDALGSLYREGRIAKHAFHYNGETLWTSLNRADSLPQRNIHQAVLIPTPKPLKPEPVRDTTKFDARKIAHNRSVFDWRP